MLPTTFAALLFPLAAGAALLLDDLPYPRSARPSGAEGPVFVVGMAGLPAEDQVTLQTLAGVLARRAPSIYTIDTGRGDDREQFWLDQLKQRFAAITWSDEFLDDFPGVLRHFRANLTGYVRYDRGGGSTNSALIRCAAAPGGVVAVGTAATAALLDGLGVPQVADVSKSSPADAFQLARANLSNRMACFQPDDGGKAAFLSDYAVFARIPTVEDHSGGSPAFTAVLDNFDPQRLNAGLGWTTWDEHQWVSHLTRAGAVAHASDYSNNLAFLSNLPDLPPPPPPPQLPRRRGAAARAEGVHTVAFVTSDGDNIQLLQHKDFIGEDHYGSPQRGTMPVGWSYSPATAALMPNALDWVRRTLTRNDSISAGPSGAGYAYPQLFRPAHAAAFARVTAELMARSGQSLANVIGVTPSAESLAPLLAQDAVKGVVYYTFGPARMGYAGLHGNVAYVGGKPVVGARLSLWGDAASGDKVGVDGLVRELATLPKDPSDPNSYSVVVSELGNSYAQLLQAAGKLEQAGGFDVVLPEELFARLVARTGGKQQCPMPTGPWSTAAGDLPKCGIAGNGSCVMTCESIGFLSHPACDLSVCHNLTLSGSRFLCDDGRACPH